MSLVKMLGFLSSFGLMQLRSEEKISEAFLLKDVH